MYTIQPIHMRNFFVYIFLCFIPLLSYGQFHTSIDLVSSIDYNREAIGFLNLDENTNFDIAINQAEYNHRFGVNFNARIFDDLLFKTGLRFAEVGFSSQKSFDDIYNVSMFGIFNPLFIISYQYRFIEIPLVFRYEIGKKKLQFYVEAGFSPHFYLNSQEVVDFELDTRTTTFDDSVKRTNIAFVFAVGVNYKISKYLQMFIQPTIRNFKNNSRIIFGILLNDRPVSYGLEIGVRRALSLEKEK